MARQAGFPEIANKKESMGICFVGKKKSSSGRGFQDFISEYINDKPGDMVDIDTGEIVGIHKGVHHWTVGQRTKVQVDERPFFVVSKDAASNVIQVASDQYHPSLYSDCFFTLSPHWISGAPDQLVSAASDKTLACSFRFQNTAILTNCHMSYNMSSTGNWEFMNRDRLIVSVAEPLKSITPGQFSVFYKESIFLKKMNS